MKDGGFTQQVRVPVMRVESVIALALIFASSTFGQRQDGPNPKSERVLLPPTAFPELPKNVVQELQGRGCTVPQTVEYENRHNVIRGEFRKTGQSDWAVVCFEDDWITILVFWNGSEQNPAQVSKWSEREESSIFKGFLGAVDKKYIMERYRASAGPKPPPIDHQGIEAGTEKASMIYYFYRDTWLILQGADEKR
jgi:hypothetical protein